MTLLSRRTCRRVLNILYRTEFVQFYLNLVDMVGYLKIYDGIIEIADPISPHAKKTVSICCSCTELKYMQFWLSFA